MAGPDHGALLGDPSRVELSGAGAGVTEDWWSVHGRAISLEEAERIAEHGLDQHWGTGRACMHPLRWLVMQIWHAARTHMLRQEGSEMGVLEEGLAAAQMRCCRLTCPTALSPATRGALRGL